MHDRSLPTLIEVIADEAEFDLARLTVELTETALVDEIDLAGKVAEEFRGKGIRLALDDFGTGYSSLLHLQSLPFQELKLDASFVRSMTQSRQSRKITAAVISLGLSLGLKTVAEGIEDQSQANLLAWQGCDIGQGYLYGRPVPAEDLPDLLTRPTPFPCVTTDVPAGSGSGFLALDARPMERFSQLRAVYDSAPVGLAFVNHQLRYVNLNQRLASANSRSIQDHLGLKVSEVLPPSLYAQIEPNMLRALQGQSIANVELTKAPAVPGDAPKTLMASYEPVRDEAGEILGLCISVADITPLKQKDEALRESEDHYRHTVELNPQMPWVADPDGHLMSISSRWTALTGMPTEEALKFGWTRVVHPDDREASVAAIMNSMKTEEPFDFEQRLRSNGDWIWMRVQGYPRRDSEGRVIRWYGSVESVDEYKRALDELRCSEARLRAVFGTAPIGLGLVESSTGRLLSANPRLEELIGFRFTPGMTWSSDSLRLFDTQGNLIPAHRRPLARCLLSGETTHSEELLLERRNGSSIWISITVAPVRLENGMQRGAVVAVQDIDRTRRGNGKLRELTRVLESVDAHTVFDAVPSF